MALFAPRTWNLFERFFQLESKKNLPCRKKSSRMALEFLEPRWNPTADMTTFQFDVPASVANLGVQVGVYSNTDHIYLAGTLGQQTFQTIPSAQVTGSSEHLQLITLVSPGTYQTSQSVSLAIPFPASTFPNNGEFRGGELIIFVGDVVNGLPITPGTNSVGAPTAAANPSTNIAPDNYAQIELTYIPQGSGAGLDIDSSSVDNVGFPFTLTYPTSGLGSTNFPINPLGITLSQNNLYSTFNTLVENGIIPQEFQQCSTFNQHFF